MSIADWLAARMRRFIRLPPLELAVSILDVKPGDSLAITTSMRLSEQAVVHLRAQCEELRERLGLRVVLVLQAGMDVKVIRGGGGK